LTILDEPWLVLTGKPAGSWVIVWTDVGTGTAQDTWRLPMPFTSWKRTSSLVGGVPWPSDTMSSVAVLLPPAPIPLPQAQSPVAQMEVNDSSWVPLWSPGEPNQPNTC